MAASSHDMGGECAEALSLPAGEANDSNAKVAPLPGPQAVHCMRDFLKPKSDNA